MSGWRLNRIWSLVTRSSTGGLCWLINRSPYEPLTAGAAGYTLAIAERLAKPYADELARLRADHAAQAGNPEPDADALAAQFQDWLAEPRTWEERRELLRTLNVQVQIGPDGVAGFQVELP
ncbi:hypothetical protein [Deinococcus sp.]|uniref:hypothetical protein n=1 Tax=Deinococcus sp. TaxID=47478 RepID=UPI003919018A